MFVVCPMATTWRMLSWKIVQSWSKEENEERAPNHAFSFASDSQGQCSGMGASIIFTSPSRPSPPSSFPVTPVERASERESERARERESERARERESERARERESERARERERERERERDLLRPIEAY